MARLASCARSLVTRRREVLSRSQRRLAYLHPRAAVARDRAELSRLTDRLARAWSGSFERRAATVGRAGARLDALSPLNVLQRGYAIATRSDGRAVRSAGDVRAGDSLRVRVLFARVQASVTLVEALDAESSALRPAPGTSKDSG
jgi:exodeoxyribonuclease VII large subunit